jgi:archaellin
MKTITLFSLLVSSIAHAEIKTDNLIYTSILKLSSSESVVLELKVRPSALKEISSGVVSVNKRDDSSTDENGDRHNIYYCETSVSFSAGEAEVSLKNATTGAIISTQKRPLNLNLGFMDRTESWNTCYAHQYTEARGDDGFSAIFNDLSGPNNQKISIALPTKSFHQAQFHAKRQGDTWTIDELSTRFFNSDVSNDVYPEGIILVYSMDPDANYPTYKHTSLTLQRKNISHPEVAFYIIPEEACASGNFDKRYMNVTPVVSLKYQSGIKDIAKVEVKYTTANSNHPYAGTTILPWDDTKIISLSESNGSYTSEIKLPETNTYFNQLYGDWFPGSRGFSYPGKFAELHYVMKITTNSGEIIWDNGTNQNIGNFISTIGGNYGYLPANCPGDLSVTQPAKLWRAQGYFN